MPRTRPKAKNVVPKPTYILAKYSGNCRCGKRISIGDLMCYDRATRQSLCVSCGKTQDAENRTNITKVDPPTTAQKLIDRLAQLRALPPPVSDLRKLEIAELQSKLERFANNNSSVKMVLLKAKLNGDFIAITARYAGNCSRCSAEQRVGEMVAYHKDQRKIYCYECIQVVCAADSAQTKVEGLGQGQYSPTVSIT